jgi:hypothetical protein
MRQTTCVWPFENTTMASLCEAYRQHDNKATASSVRIAFILFPSHWLGASLAPYPRCFEAAFVWRRHYRVRKRWLQSADG